MAEDDPQVVALMRDFKARLLAQEEALMREMAAQWLKVERSLTDELQSLALEAARMQAEGLPVNQAILYRMEHTQRLLWDLKARTGDFSTWADEAITKRQEELAGLGLESAAGAIEAIMADAGISAAFDRLNINAMQAFMGLAGDGSPLSVWLRNVQPDAADGILNALLDGLTRGLNPTKIAALMADGMGMGLQRALNLARTETLRAYRMGSLMQFQQSGVVIGYKRIAAHDERVCAGCLLTEGEIYTDLSQFDEHNQGRCAAIPVVMGVPEPRWLSGAAWFETQSEQVQESILGSGRFNAWKNGTPLADMFMRVVDPVWGGAFVPRPVWELGG